MSNRTNEPVTVGIPLPDAYANTSTFTINGVTAAQFRPLAYYPSGNIKWVLCDFQSTVASGGAASVTLTNTGAGNFGGSNLATDGGATISINTGVAQFRIRKANFNVFDNVVVNGTTLVSAQTGECIWWNGTTDEKFSSINDAASTAVIEENGPVRCCIKATGALKNAGGTRVVNFTMRMHFFKDKSYVRASFTVRNDDTTQLAPRFFHAIEVKVPLTVTNGTVTLAKKSGVVTQVLSSGQRATLFQAFSTDKANSNINAGASGWDVPLPGSGDPYTYTAKGLEIVVGTTTFNALGDQTDYTQGYGDLSTAAGAGCTVALRWMSAYWPAGFDLGADGTISIELYSKRNSKTSMKLANLKHEWREILWDFHTTTNDKTLSVDRLQTPLLARAPLSHYISTQSVYGTTDFPTPSEQAARFTALGHSSLFSLANFNTSPATKIFRWWAWPQGGGDNQTDEPLDNLTDFLRGGPNGHFWRSYARTFFNKTAAWHVQPGQEATAYDYAANDPNFFSLHSVNGMNDCFNSAHFHMMSLPMTYFVTGNEEFKEAVDMIRRFYRRVMVGGGDFVDTSGSLDFRAWCRGHRNLALCYEFQRQTDQTADATILTVLKASTDRAIDARDNASLGTSSPIGRSMARGYFYGDKALVPGVLNYRPAHSLFHSQMYFEALWQVQRIYRVFGVYRDAEIEDMLEGLARFYMDESFDDSSVPLPRSGTTDQGFFYDYALDFPYPAYASWGSMPSPWTSNGGITLWPFDASRAAIYAYYKSGDTTYLDRGLELLWRVNDFGNAYNSSELQGQALLAAKERPPAAWRSMSVTATPSGSNYNLSWNTPTGATAYEIKYSPRPIVNSLGYNRATQTYTSDPASFTPYFAASRVSNVPPPPATSMTVSGLPSGQQFAMRYLK